MGRLGYCVALRKESVDRNCPLVTRFPLSKPSLSARRAWIEISAEDIATSNWSVALRKESVDRNCGCLLCAALDAVSLSARRAWIEMGVAISVITF